MNEYTIKMIVDKLSDLDRQCDLILQELAVINDKLDKKKKEIKKITKQYEEGSAPKELTNFFIELCSKANTRFKPPVNINDWADVFRKMMEIDKIPEDEIAATIIWVFEESDFWHKVILSPGSLRKHYAKIHAQRGGRVRVVKDEL